MTTRSPKVFELSSHAAAIAEKKEQIADLWVSQPKVQTILPTKMIDLQEFRNIYAVGAIEYFITILENRNRTGDCPVIQKMLQTFAEHNISSQEIFLVCSQFKRSLHRFAFQAGFASESIIDEINYILDENLSGIIARYDEMIQQFDNQLQSKRKKLNQYLDAIDASAIISRADLNGNITHVNKKFEEVSGYTKEELIGSPHSIVRHPDTPKETFKELWETIQNKQPFFATLKNRHKNGSAYYVNTYIAPILDANNNIVEYLSIRQNITEIMSALEKEHQVNIMKDEFLRNMSHEIRTPLNGIIGFTALLKKRITEPKLQDYLTSMEHSSQRLMKLLDNILELSRLNSGTYQINTTHTVIYPQLASAMIAHKKHAKESGITLSYDIESCLNRELVTNYMLIQRILDILIDNAIKFNREEGSVDVKVNCNDSHLRLVVEDSGIGIRKGEQAEIFKIFHQTDASATRTYEGAGVGLAILSKLVELLGGTITVESEEDKGTRFSIDMKA